MSIDKVRGYFGQYGMESRILEFDVSSATVELAAQALSVQPARIAKTLSFKLGEGCILVVTAGDARIDNAKFKARFGVKAKMLAFDEVEPLTGSAVGGVCPFAVPDRVPVYLDDSLKRFYTVFPACGSDNSAIEMSCEELFRFSGAKAWVDVCKDWAAEYDPPFCQTLFEDPGTLGDGEIFLKLLRVVPANARMGFVPAYKFAIARCSDGAELGLIDLRVGYVRGTYYGGNIGYEVQPQYRGSRYAEKAVRALLPLARRHGMPCVRICCAPQNAASRITIERAGGVLEERATLPSYTNLYREGVRGEHLIYRFNL